MTRLLLSLLLLALVGTAHSQLAQAPAAAAPSPLEIELSGISDLDELRQRVARYRAANDLASETLAWRRLSEVRPHMGELKYELAAAYARQEMKSAAYTALLELQAQGYGFDLSKDQRFAPVATTRAWEYIVESLEKNLEPFGEIELARQLPATDSLMESLAWDAGRKQLLVGSMREGAVYRVGKDGALQPLARADDKNGMWAVMDIVADTERNVLWVASTAVPHFKGYQPERDLGRAGVFKFDLGSGKFLKSYLSPSTLGAAFFMSTLALAPDGTVYAADGVNNAVYMVRDDQLKRVFHATTLSSIRGMTLDGSGRILYFADFDRGVFGYDLAAGKPFEVAVPRNLALGGIDGLVWRQGSLLAVQNGMQPSRVMRLALAPDGRSFIGAQPLAAGQPGFGVPTLATLAGDRLYFIGNSQKHRYDRFGLPRKADELEGARIFSVQADFASAEPAFTPAPRQPAPAAHDAPRMSPPKGD